MKIMPELLVPARDFETGIAAVNAGADAVYIGPSVYGARKGAGNSLRDIAKLIAYAHQYHVRVYPTVNTVIHEKELETARELIFNLYNEGADAIIFQDLSLLQMELPPVALFASTQTHNYEPERIKWLESFGVSRFILARELDLDQIREIRKQTKAGLEFFIHGALCVCFSGRCYFSKAVAGRSGNRGECAQPCRSYYNLFDEKGKIIAKNKHVLSLKDLNLTDYLYELHEAGITSYKIEGRLKDIHYVKNTVGWYRKAIDGVFGKKGFSERPSSGKVRLGFDPDPEKVFNRGFTNYFISGRRKENVSPDTQKSTGKRLGKVIGIAGNTIMIDNQTMPEAGDGICFFAKYGKLSGTRVEKINGRNIILASAKGLSEGSELFRNYDHNFAKQLDSPDSAVRKIPVSFILSQKKNKLILSAIDNEGNNTSAETEFVPEPAKNPVQQIEIKKQLSKAGNTIYEVSSVTINLDDNYFFRTSFLNELRRNCLEKLTEVRVENLKKLPREKISDRPSVGYKPGSDENITNRLSAEFFKNNTGFDIPVQNELNKDMKGEVILHTRFCLRYENGICPGKNASPLTMKDNQHTYKVEFDCEKCEMRIWLVE